jgi:FUS-interacting serine-arginine-rich protein 1
VKDVYLPLDFHTKQRKGFAFVEFEEYKDAEGAQASMDKMVLDERELQVEFARQGRKTADDMRYRGGNDRGYDDRGPPRRYDDRRSDDRGPPRRYDDRRSDDRGPPAHHSSSPLDRRSRTRSPDNRRRSRSPPRDGAGGAPADAPRRWAEPDTAATPAAPVAAAAGEGQE